jgi:WD40 repeat protein
VLLKHPREIVTVRVAPGGAYAATGGAEGSIRIWGLAPDPKAPNKLERAARHLLEGHRGPVAALAFTSDGKQLASAGQDGTVWLWDIETGKGRLLLDKQGGGVHAVVFSPDAKRLATSGEDRTIRVWDASSGALLFVLPRQPAPVRSLVYVDGGKRLLSASEDGTVRTWDADTGGQGLRLPIETSALVFSPDGKQLVTASGTTVAVREAGTGTPLFTLAGHEGTVRYLAFTADHKALAVGSVLDRPGGKFRIEVKLWDLLSRKQIHTLRRDVEAPPPALFVGNGNGVLLPEDKGHWTVWDTRTGVKKPRPPRWVDEEVVSVYSPDGRYFATVDPPERCERWRSALPSVTAMPAFSPWPVPTPRCASGTPAPRPARTTRSDAWDGRPFTSCRDIPGRCGPWRSARMAGAWQLSAERTAGLGARSSSGTWPRA